MTSLYPSYPPTEFTPLTIQGGGFSEFPTLVQKLRSRWVKVEFLQHYDESGSGAFDAFLRGDYDTAAREVSRAVKSQAIYEHARAHGVEMIRVRVYRLPLTDYLARFEYHAYVADLEMGETILTLNWSKVADLVRSTGVSDFLLFDDLAAVALLYDEIAGQVREARLITDTEEIKKYAAMSEALIGAAEDFSQGEFARLAREAH